MRIVAGIGIEAVAEEIGFLAEADICRDFGVGDRRDDIQGQPHGLFTTIGAIVGEGVQAGSSKGHAPVDEGQVFFTDRAVHDLRRERPDIDGGTALITRAETGVGRLYTQFVAAGGQAAYLRLLVIVDDGAVQRPGIGSGPGNAVGDIGGRPARAQVGRPGDDRGADYRGGGGGTAEHVDLEFTDVACVAIDDEEVGIAGHQAAGVEYGRVKTGVAVGYRNPAGAVDRLVDFGLQAVADLAGRSGYLETDTGRTRHKAYPLDTVELWSTELGGRFPLRLVGIHSYVTVDVTEHTGLRAERGQRRHIVRT